jgi:hypothetical protein
VSRPIAAALLAISTLCWGSAVHPQVVSKLASPSRDAALVYLRSVEYVVRRVDGDCSVPGSRSDSSGRLERVWRERHASYLHAAEKYLHARLDELQRSGGSDVAKAIDSAVQTRSVQLGEANVRVLLPNISAHTCDAARELVEAGRFDVSPVLSNYDDLARLVVWAAQWR